MQKTLIIIAILFYPLIGFSQDTLRLSGKYRGVDISFDPFDESYLTKENMNVFKTSISKILINGVPYKEEINSYPFTIELSKLGFKNRDKVEILIICKNKNKFTIKPPKGIEIMEPKR